MRLTICGAARQVTGSMHLLELAGGYRILIDCGLDYERGKDVTENDHFPFEPSSIDLVILTHAHIDHSGNLPTLVKNGYNGQILCTSATADLAHLLLSDSANLFINRSKKKKHHRKQRSKEFNTPPLYLHKHVMDTMERMVTIPFDTPFTINEELKLEFISVGHLLGAAAVILTVQEEGKEKKIAFSGDIGRKNYPILKDPQGLPPVDFLVCESTYGGRTHSTGSIEETLIRTIRETCIDTPGRLIIPAFSIGRTQALIYCLNKIFSDKKLPPVKLFVDSPLAMAGTDIYRKYQHLLNDEAQDFYKTRGDEFSFDELSYVETLKESKQISNYFEPCVIISSAGMLEGGRIQDHLYYNIQNYYCTILFIGYCAKGTLGRRLLDGVPIVKINGRDLFVYAGIKQTDLFSAHADHEGLMSFIRSADKERLAKVFLVHGEPESMENLQADLQSQSYETVIPEKEISYEL